jgi:hypothetical protein
VRGAPLPGMAGRAPQQGRRCPETAQDALSTLPSHSGGQGSYRGLRDHRPREFLNGTAGAAGANRIAAFRQREAGWQQRSVGTVFGS